MSCESCEKFRCENCAEFGKHPCGRVQCPELARGTPMEICFECLEWAFCERGKG